MDKLREATKAPFSKPCARLEPVVLGDGPEPGPDWPVGGDGAHARLKPDNVYPMRFAWNFRLAPDLLSRLAGQRLPAPLESGQGGKRSWFARLRLKDDMEVGTSNVSQSGMSLRSRRRRYWFRIWGTLSEGRPNFSCLEEPTPVQRFQSIAHSNRLYGYIGYGRASNHFQNAKP